MLGCPEVPVTGSFELSNLGTVNQTQVALEDQQIFVTTEDVFPTPLSNLKDRTTIVPLSASELHKEAPGRICRLLISLLCRSVELIFHLLIKENFEQFLKLSEHRSFHPRGLG